MHYHFQDRVIGLFLRNMNCPTHSPQQGKHVVMIDRNIRIGGGDISSLFHPEFMVYLLSSTHKKHITPIQVTYITGHSATI